MTTSPSNPETTTIDPTDVSDLAPSSRTNESPSPITDPANTPITNDFSQKQTKVWSWPWAIFLVFLYVFILIWMNYAILVRYWIKHAWNDSLPGLDKTALRKFTMRMHMTTGAFAMLLGPLQFVPYFRKTRIHRWSGRVYCTCAMLSSIFGLWFIALKRRLVGGYNMTAAFSIGGAAIGIFAFKAWQTARAARSANAESSSSASFVFHRNWGIRSYSQIVAPALYRYWYITMELFGLYDTPTPLRLGGYCDENDQCPDYKRTWDAIYCWAYWMSAWLVAEIVIYCLPNFDSNDKTFVTSPSPSDAMTAPLLSNADGNTTITDNEGDNPRATTSYGSDIQSPSDPSAVTREISATALDSSKDFSSIVNLIGVLLACAAVAISSKTLYMMFT